MFLSHTGKQGNAECAVKLATVMLLFRTEPNQAYLNTRRRIRKARGLLDGLAHERRPVARECKARTRAGLNLLQAIL